MNISSRILLINLTIFTAYSLAGKSSRDIFVMMLGILVQFVVNIISGFTARKGKGAYFLSAFLVLIIGFAVCVSDL
jgi:lipopolysaccharide export LptBFGC system permease protein LptF